MIVKKVPMSNSACSDHLSPATHCASYEERQTETVTTTRLLGRAGVLGDGFGALRHGVLGQLAGKDEPNAANGLV